MKKVKEVKYSHDTPVEIQELMGTEPYRYIHNYTTYNGLGAKMDPPPQDPRIITKTKTIDIIKVPLQDVIKKFEKIIQDPSYISAYLDYYGYNSIKLYYQTKVPTSLEAVDMYEAAIAVYNAEKEIFEKLQKLAKRLNEDRKQAVIKLEIEKLEKRLAQLRK